MGQYVQWVTYKGVKILFLNGGGLEEKQYLAALDDLQQELLRDRSSPPVLLDLTRTAMTTSIASRAKKLAEATKSEGLPDAPCAVVGLSKLAKSVAQLFGRGARYFDTLEEGREYLASEAGKRFLPY